MLPGGREGAAVFVVGATPAFPFAERTVLSVAGTRTPPCPVDVLRESGVSERRHRDTSFRSSEVEEVA